MDYIHKDSDLLHEVNFVDSDNKPIAIPQCPFEITYWTNDFDKKEASFDGDKYTNCIVENGKLFVTIDNPRFDQAKLRCKIALHYPDIRFENGFYDATYVQDIDFKIIGDNGK